MKMWVVAGRGAAVAGGGDVVDAKWWGSGVGRLGCGHADVGQWRAELGQWRGEWFSSGYIWDSDDSRWDRGGQSWSSGRAGVGHLSLRGAAVRTRGGTVA